MPPYFVILISKHFVWKKIRPETSLHEVRSVEMYAMCATSVQSENWK